MKVTKRKLAIVAVVIVLLLVAGGVGTYLLRRGGAKGGASAADAERESPHYMLLDKVLVSVPAGRDPNGGMLGPYRVCSGDFAFDVGHDDAHLDTRQPLLRSVIVHVLSQYTYDDIRRMPIEQLRDEVRRQLLGALASQDVKQPFKSVLVTQFICE